MMSSEYAVFNSVHILVNSAQISPNKQLIKSQRLFVRLGNSTLVTDRKIAAKPDFYRISCLLSFPYTGVDDVEFLIATDSADPTVASGKINLDGFKVVPLQSHDTLVEISTHKAQLFATLNLKIELSIKCCELAAFPVHNSRLILSPASSALSPPTSAETTPSSLRN